MTALRSVADRSTGPSGLPWWARPSTVNLLFILPILLTVMWAGASDFSGSQVRTRSYLAWPYIALCVVLVLVSVAGAWLGENLKQRTFFYSTEQYLVRATICLGLVVLATYFFWYRSLLLSPALLLNILTGGEKPDRSEIGTVTGITSLVNFAPVFFGLAGYLLFVCRARDRMLIALTSALLLFTAFRTYIWSERLAFVEAIIPLALALVSTMRPKPEHRLRTLLYLLGPYAALPAVFAFFAVTEFFRSWSYYQDRMGFWDFAFGRFVSYYYTSLNNGAGMLATDANWPAGTFQTVLGWLHKFPLGIGPVFSASVGSQEHRLDDFLARYADPEFNTTSSFLSVTLDLGVAGAMLYFFLSMFCAGILYSRYIKGDLLSLMLYPSVLLALFEAFRYPYWGNSRAFVWLLGAVGVWAVLWMCGAISSAKSSAHASRFSPAH